MDYNEKSIDIAIDTLEVFAGCPSVHGLKNIDDCMDSIVSCKECWREALMKEPEEVMEND